ncbi:MAG: Rid family detoxifying hydrolase [Candidatus Cloacimonetes bacterium]|nr:Rid family detoxifying hydrolase [Candidatus Cloacimonadota bacterium]
MKIIHTMKAPAAIGPYSQATVCNGILYSSMQIGIDPSNGKLAEGFIAQVEQVMHNLRGILEEAGLGFGKALQARVCLTDLDNYKPFNDIYSRYFREVLPAREVVEVSRLPVGAQVGVSLIASS